MNKLGDYSLGQVIGLGGSSVVFSGSVKSVQQDFDVALPIVLKVVKDVDAARREVRNLAQLAPVSQFCNLHDAFVVSREEFHQFAGPKLRAIEAYLGQALFGEPDSRWAVLVLNMVAGEKLIDRFEAQDRDPLVPEGAWLVRGKATTFVERLSEPVFRAGIKTRKLILMELARALAKKHKIHRVHGDLNPANLLWQPQSNEVTLLDMGLHRNFGVPGWKSPEHEQLRVDAVQELPCASDVYVLGIWIQRLLPAKASWQSMARKCLQPDIGRRPTAAEVFNEMRNRFYASHYKYLFAGALLLASVLGFVLLRQASEPSLESIFPDDGLAYIEEIKSMDFANIANPRPIRLKTENYLKHKDMTPELRENLIRSIAWYFFNNLGPKTEATFSGKAEDIRAIWMGPGKLPPETWILYEGNDRWVGLGRLVGGNTFFLKAELNLPDIFLYFETLDGQKTVLKAPHFPYPWTEFEESMLFLYKSSFESVLENLALQSDYLAVIPDGVKTVLRGVLYFGSTEELVDLLIASSRGDLSKEGNLLHLKAGLGNEYVSWKYGGTYYPKINAKRMAHYLLRENQLTIGGGEEYIKDVNYHGLKAHDIFWMDILQHYCLEDGAGYYIDDGKIYFYKK